MKLFNSISTLILLAVIFVSGQVFSAPTALDGKWKLQTRTCSSGAIPRDNIDFQIYAVTVEYNDGQFKFYSESPTCFYKSEGFFKFDGKLLTSYPTEASNCYGPVHAPVTKTNAFLSADQLSFIVLPNFAVCPAGDYINNSYKTSGLN